MEEAHTSNRTPAVLCPACFKGYVIFNYARNEAQCGDCGQQFRTNGSSLRFK